MQAKLVNRSYYFLLRSFRWSLKEFHNLSQKCSESWHKYASNSTFFYSFTEKNNAGAPHYKKLQIGHSALLRPCTGGLFSTLFHSTFLERHTVFPFFRPLWKPQERYSWSYRHYWIHTGNSAGLFPGITTAGCTAVWLMAWDDGTAS